MEALKLMIFEREIDDVVESLRNAKIHGRKTALLIGTGCSAQAGVPTAAKVVDMIKETRPLDYERAPKKNVFQKEVFKIIKESGMTGFITRIPVLENADGTILWVPGIRAAEQCRVSDSEDGYALFRFERR